MLSSRGRNGGSRRIWGGSTLLKSIGALIVGRVVDFLLMFRLAEFEALDARLLPSTIHEGRVEERCGEPGLGRSS